MKGREKRLPVAAGSAYQPLILQTQSVRSDVFRAI
jgi:hypothetical protein